jgi:hypothetical protein
MAGKCAPTDSTLFSLGKHRSVNRLSTSPNRSAEVNGPVEGAAGAQCPLIKFGSTGAVYSFDSDAILGNELCRSGFGWVADANPGDFD